MPSSESAKPSSTGVTPTAASVLTIGIVPPERRNTGSVLNARAAARAAARRGGCCTSSTTAGHAECTRVITVHWGVENARACASIARTIACGS